MTIRIAAVAVALATGAALAAAPAASAAPGPPVKVIIGRGGPCYLHPTGAQPFSGSVQSGQITYWDGSGPQNRFLYIQCSNGWAWYYQNEVHEV